jgi:hypothetical protein
MKNCKDLDVQLLAVAPPSQTSEAGCTVQDGVTELSLSVVHRSYNHTQAIECHFQLLLKNGCG